MVSYELKPIDTEVKRGNFLLKSVIKANGMSLCTQITDLVIPRALESQQPWGYGLEDTLVM